MANRFELRARYIEGWYERDTAKLLSSVADDFIFDDPAEPAPVSKAGLSDYMARWYSYANGCNEWILSHEVREDKNGILTDWEWFEVVGTDLQGSGLVKTRDDGVFLERITYFNRGKGK